MKCPSCQHGTMERRKERIDQDGVEFEAWQCGQCGEEILTMPQLRALATKYRNLRRAKEVTFAKWGNSLALRIPREVAEEYHLVAGTPGLLTKAKRGLLIVPAH